MELQSFDFHGHAVGVFGTEENLMFVLNDVAKVLGIKNIGVLVGWSAPGFVSRYLPYFH